MTNTDHYFTEIEDHFRARRGTALLMLSPLDWALIETWKNSGIPLEAVLRGIDTAFERWRKRPVRGRARAVNSLAYCGNAIAEEAQAMANGIPAVSGKTNLPFNLEDLRAYIAGNAAKLREAGHGDLAWSLEVLDLDSLSSDVELLEERLTAIEEAMIAMLRSSASEEALTEARRDLDRDLKPYKGKMTADQLAVLEKQFLERRLLELANLPRLSLFYL